jgi:hypothetical protein
MMADLVKKDFKMIALRLLEKPKEDLENVKKMISKQSRNINREIFKPKKKPKKKLWS